MNEQKHSHVIYPYQWARDRVEVKIMKLSLTNLPKLQNIISNNEQVSFEVKFLFGYNDQQQLFVKIKIDGLITFCCARCLQPYNYLLHVTNDIHLKYKNEKYNHTKEQDIWELDKNGMLDLLDLVDEEIILGLPMVPKHDFGDSGCLYTHNSRIFCDNL